VTDASTFPVRRPRGSVVLALVRRDYLLTASYRFSLVLDLFFGVVHLVIFYFISRTFQNATTAQLQGAPSYFAFAAVGIALTVVIEAASTGLAQKIREEQLTGTLEVLLGQPVTEAELATGLAGFPFLFATVRAALYIFIAGLFLDVDLSRTSWLGFVCVLFAAGMALSCLGVLLGALVLVLKRGEVLAGLFTFALGLVSGAFFPISVLPDWLQPIGKVVPTRFAFEGLRRALFGGAGWGGDVGWLLLFAVVSAPIGVWIFSKALDYAKRAGTLTQY
jgi:ABC-2 type transport system permease protein